MIKRLLSIIAVFFAMYTMALSQSTCKVEQTFTQTITWTVAETTPILSCPTSIIDLGNDPSTTPSVEATLQLIRVEDACGEVYETGELIELSMNPCARATVVKVEIRDACNQQATCEVVFNWTNFPVCSSDTICENGGLLTHHFDETTCACIAADIEVVCQTIPVCDSIGNLFMEVYDSTTCSCLPVPISVPICSTDTICDGTGSVLVQQYNNNNCICETVPIVPPLCDTTKVCDGWGQLTQELYDPTTCACITTSIAPPSCDDNNCATEDKYEEESCSCVYQPINCPSTPSCDLITISGSDNGLLRISHLVAPIEIVQVYDSNWEQVYTCVSDCKELEEIALTDGRYYVSVQLFTASWEYICGTKSYQIIKSITSPTCGLSGGSISGDDLEFCVGDGQADKIEQTAVLLTGNTGVHSQWVLTDAAGAIILGLPTDLNEVDFDGVSVGSCLLWHLSYEGQLEGLEQGAKVSEIEGCLAWSNSMQINRIACPDVDTLTMQTNCGVIDITYGNGSIHLEAEQEQQYIYKVALISPTWRSYLDCSASPCKSTQTLTALPAGTYSIRVWTSSWGKVCGETRITLKESSSNTETTVEEQGTETTQNTTLNDQYECGEVRISYGDGTIHLLGRPGKEYYFKVLPQFGNWQHVLNCTNSCGNEAMLTHLQNGNYSIQIFNSDWTSACERKHIELTDKHFQEHSLSRTSSSSLVELDQNYASSIAAYSIYPNPANQEIFINLKKFAGQSGEIELINYLGQTIRQESYKIIPVTPLKLVTRSLAKGLYFIKISIDQNTIITEQLLIDKR